MTHAAQFVLTHGALVLFLWILIQQIGLPIPSAPLLILVGSLASSGRIDFASSLMAAFGASFLADSFWYHMGLKWSRSDYLRPTTTDWKGRVLTLINRHFGWSAGSVKICWYLEFGFASGEARASLSSAVSAL